MSQNEKQYFWMTANKVIVEIDGAYQEAELNVLVQTDTVNFRAIDLRNLTRNTALRYHQNSGVSLADVKNVIIGNIFPLGHMTMEEFNAGADAETAAEKEQPAN